MALTTYFDFADNDYKFFMFNYEHNHENAMNAMGSIAQGICERYMKHLIDTYFDPETDAESNEMERVLRTHSLARLINFLDRRMNIVYSENAENKMRIIDGFYFTTRYPGDDSIQLTERDIERCAEAVQACRAETIEIAEEIAERGHASHGDDFAMEDNDTCL